MSGVDLGYRMAGLRAKKALEMAALQVADTLVRYLTQGLISATVEDMETADGGPGTKTYTVGPAHPVRGTLDPWPYVQEFVVRANGFAIAGREIDFTTRLRLELFDAGLRHWPDGGYELILGNLRVGCRLSLKRGEKDYLLLGDLKREFEFAGSISVGGSQTGEEVTTCPYGLDVACPLRPAGGEPAEGPGVG